MNDTLPFPRTLKEREADAAQLLERHLSAVRVLTAAGWQCANEQREDGVIVQYANKKFDGSDDGA